ncbi:Neural cell adhesion molecule 2 [Trachymyrmex septentrionalis]|uniref:Neural cell adhesion molecule 2 n=1 Tax=Trachymyrmex septentrionalis TaxID=34720 RepID=A0A195F8Y1_9HYME|nr:Neural cell adhesion molecule 2 [Trachymyrmex septentrionalis]
MAAPWCGFDRNAGKERKSQRRTRRWKTSERADSVAEDDSAVREGYPALKSERKKSDQSNVKVPKEKEEERIYIYIYSFLLFLYIYRDIYREGQKFYPADLDSFGQTASQPVRPSSNARIFIRFLGNFVAPPYFSVPISDVSAIAGFKAKIPCDIDPPIKGETVIMVFWYKDEKNGEPIYSVDVRGRQIAQARLWSDPYVFGERAVMKTDVKPAELEINPLEFTDGGVYRCRVDFKNSPTKNQEINLTVIVPPKKPVIYTGASRSLAKILQPFNEGSEMSLLCEVIGGLPPPRVTWYFDDEVLDDTYTQEHDDITINRLDIRRVTRDFLRTRLICKANNTQLMMPLTSEVILDVNLKPLVVNITNKRFHLSALRTYEIECVSSGSRPEAVITWWKGTHQVKHMARNFADNPNVTRSVLSYVPTIEDDGKFLTCRAENPVVPNSALEDKWHLLVYYAPVVSIKLGSSLKANDINEGDDVYFECDVRANPRSYKLLWFKDGKELHQNATAGIILPGGRSLVLQSVTKSSAGEYSCMAANVEGKSASRPVALEVMYAPICKDGSSTQVVGALKHETISLVCGVQSKPPPTTFHWTFNNSGELMSVPATKYAQVKPLSLITNHWHGSRLNYTPENDMDYGTVACWARNRIGVQRTPCLFQIIVAGKPYPLQNCTALQSTGPYAYRMGHEDFKATDSRDADWLIVRCSEGFDGGLPLTNYELEVYSEENVYHVNTIYLNHTDRSGSSGPVFEVPGLEPGRNYRLHLYAVNAKGRSDPVVLEPVTLKGVAMYTTGRGISDETTDYSLLVACFAGGITAICILIVGITLTLYRRNHPMQTTKARATEPMQYESKENRPAAPAATNEAHRDELKEQINADDVPDDDPDVIPSKAVERRPDIFEPDYASSKPSERAKDFRCLEDLDYPSPSSVLHAKDSWVYPNGYAEKSEKSLSPIRPSTLPVHRTHDIYTRSLRVQESCI